MDYEKQWRTNVRDEERLREIYDGVGMIVGELVSVRSGEKWFHAHRNGTPAYENRYDAVGDSFVEGMTWARMGKEWFHIRPDGTPAYKERFEMIGPFYMGLASVTKDKRTFQIRPDGTKVEV